MTFLNFNVKSGQKSSPCSSPKPNLLPNLKTIHGLPQLVPKGKDGRREIKEMDLNNGSFQHFRVIEGIETKGYIPLGNHFHREKFEVFNFIQGGGTLRIAPVDDKGAICGEVEIIEIFPETVVEILPGITHRFDLKAGTIFTCYSSKPFDANDMIPCLIPI